MECLGVEQIIQFLCHPLKDSLNDKDPYVRKTGAQRYVETLVELVKNQIGFVIQEAIIGLRDIFWRKTFEGAMTVINENLRNLDDPEARAALFYRWILWYNWWCWKSIKLNDFYHYLFYYKPYFLFWLIF